MIEGNYDLDIADDTDETTALEYRKYAVTMAFTDQDDDVGIDIKGTMNFDVEILVENMGLPVEDVELSDFGIDIDGTVNIDAIKKSYDIIASSDFGRGICDYEILNIKKIGSRTVELTYDEIGLERKEKNLIEMRMA